MQEKSWEIKEIPAWVSQKGASALFIGRNAIANYRKHDLYYKI